MHRAKSIFMRTMLTAGAGILAQATMTLAEPAKNVLSPEQAAISDIGVAPSDLQVVAWVDRQDNTYKVGDQVALSVQTTQPAYITVIAVNPEGVKTVIYPNRRNGSRKIEGGKVAVLGKFRVSPPVGKEVLKVIASTEPLKLTGLIEGKEFDSLKASAESVAKDIGVEGPKNKRAVATKVVQTVSEDPSDAGGEQEGTRLSLKTDRPLYRINDAITISVRVSEACKLTLVNVGTSGNAIVLYPVKGDPPELIEPGKWHSFPRKGTKSQLKLKGPAGTERLLAFCQKDKTPFEDDFVEDGDTLALRNFDAKDIGHTSPPEQASSGRAEITFVVLPGN